jgi:hypothetical protein
VSDYLALERRDETVFKELFNVLTGSAWFKLNQREPIRFSGAQGNLPEKSWGNETLVKQRRRGQKFGTGD